MSESSSDIKEISQLDKRLTLIEDRMENVDHVLFGNGQKGMNIVLTEFVAEYRATEKERSLAQESREKRDEIRSRNVNTFLAILTVIVLLGTGIVAYLGYISAKHIGAVSDSPSLYSSRYPESSGGR